MRATRKSKGLSVAKAAAAIDVSSATLKRWESGSGLPGWTVLTQVIEAWGATGECPLREIWERDGRHKEDGVACGERPLLRILRTARRRAGLTLDELSVLTGVSAPSLYRYETGQRTPRPETLRSLCGALGLSGCEGAAVEESLDAGRATEGPDPVPELFLRPGGLSRVAVFRQWDRLMRAGSSSPGWTDLAWDVLHGLMIMGDHRAALELWGDIRGPVRGAHTDSDRLTKFRTTLALAKTSLGGRSLDLPRLAGHVVAMRPGPEQAQALLQMTRIERASGDGAAANEWCSLAGRWSDRTGDTAVGFLVELNARDIEFAFGSRVGALDAVEALRARAVGALQRYNADVALAGMRAAVGDVRGAESDLEQCRRSESTYGFGSPLARRIERRLVRKRDVLSSGP